MYKRQGKKPVYWCPHDETALAEAEIEYSEDPCKSIYVKFKVKDDHGKLAQYCDLDNLYFLIWTTTTWTCLLYTSGARRRTSARPGALRAGSAASALSLIHI